MEGGARSGAQQRRSLGGQAGREREGVPHAGLERLARERRAVIRRGTQHQDPRGPRHRFRQPRRPSRRPEAPERGEQRPEVLPGIVATRVDEVPLRQTEALALGGEACARGVAFRRAGRLRRVERVVTGKRHDPDPGRTQPEETHGRGRNRVAGDEHQRRVAEELPAKPLAEPRSRRAPVLLRQLPRREVQEGRDDRQAGTDRERPGHRVRDHPGRPGGGGAAARAETRRAHEERVERERARAEDSGRREPPSPGERKTGEGDHGILGTEVEQRNE